MPLKLRSAMHESPIVVVEADLESRVEHSFRNYILQKLSEWQEWVAVQADDEIEKKSAFELFAEELQKSMFNIRKRLGGVRHQQLTLLLNHALVAHKAGDDSLHREWIRILLNEYYDPQYDYLLAQRKERIAFRGNARAVEEYLFSKLPVN